jgi:metal-responsive CopG/Arc/MetJ family transcriptional regulator
MAMRKMTFTIPDEVATPFLRAVPSTRRSKFVADALRKTLNYRETDLIAACQAANAYPELNTLVDDCQAVNDAIAEPWDEGISG